MKMINRFLLAALMGVSVSLTALADHHKTKEVPLPNKLIIGSLGSSSDKIVQLAKAIPEEDYGWRPMEGVSSVGEVLGHVAGANYYIGRMLGAEMPEGVNPAEMGKDATKDDLIAQFQASVVFAKKAVAGVSAEAMAEEIEFFGMKAPRGQLVMILADHGHEHLGQLIAYARSNQVVPPWSQ